MRIVGIIRALKNKLFKILRGYTPDPEQLNLYRQLKRVKKIKGIIQVGANNGQEVLLFQRFSKKLILFEPIPKLVAELRQKYSGVQVFAIALGFSDGEMSLFLASNNGESSSLLPPTGHKILYPGITFKEQIQVPVRKFSTLVKEQKIQVSEFNVLVTDTQGYDLEVLKGFESHILNMDLIILEYINSNLYENDSNLIAIQEYLQSFNFNLIETFDENSGAGNAVFGKISL